MAVLAKVRDAKLTVAIAANRAGVAVGCVVHAATDALVGPLHAAGALAREAAMAAAGPLGRHVRHAQARLAHDARKGAAAAIDFILVA